MKQAQKEKRLFTIKFQRFRDSSTEMKMADNLLTNVLPQHPWGFFVIKALAVGFYGKLLFFALFIVSLFVLFDWLTFLVWHFLPIKR